MHIGNGIIARRSWYTFSWIKNESVCAFYDLSEACKFDSGLNYDDICSLYVEAVVISWKIPEIRYAVVSLKKYSEFPDWGICQSSFHLLHLHTEGWRVYLETKSKSIFLRRNSSQKYFRPKLCIMFAFLRGIYFARLYLLLGLFLWLAVLAVCYCACWRRVLL